MVLTTADGTPTQANLDALGTSAPTLNQLRRRYQDEGVEGLQKGKAQPPRVSPLPVSRFQEVLTLTLTGKPAAATRWSCRTLAQRVGIARRAVHRIGRAHRL